MVFKDSKSYQKTGPLNVFVPMANVLVEGSTFQTRKIDVSKRHLLQAVKTPPYPLPKKQLLSEAEERRTKNEQILVNLILRSRT